MRNFFYKSSFKTKVILLTFFIMCSLFISENVFSRNNWTRAFVSVSVSLVKNEYCIAIDFEFIDYVFGPFGEHAYLKYCDFAYSMDGKSYSNFLTCEAFDQLHMSSSVLKLTDTLLDKRSRFTLNHSPWPQDKVVVWIELFNISKKGYLTVRWFMATYFKIKDIMITGLWHVNGLYCSDKIDGVVYPVEYDKLSNTKLKSKSKLKFVNEQSIVRPDEGDLKVSKNAHAIIVTGAALGENILVYTTSGTLVNSMFADESVVNIKLPANQMYIVKVGQACYKVAL